jgi:spermidine synthase
VETVYHCARVVADEQRPGGRLLVLDTLRHSYVDLDDPTHLEFRYTRIFADVVATAAPPGRLDVLHVGGGGFTLPRFLKAARPGTVSTVLEIDPGIVDLARRRLGLVTAPDLQVRVDDARLAIEDVPRSAYDVVFGDAFGGLAVPWHLTTVEFVRAVHAVLRPGGLYVLNVIDAPPLRFARAETATLLAEFDNVTVVTAPGGGGGNYVLAASDGPLDLAAIHAAVGARGGQEGVTLGRTFADGARVLTDDYAPVDQWLARDR